MPKNCSIHFKNYKISGPYNFYTSDAFIICKRNENHDKCIKNALLHIHLAHNLRFKFCSFRSSFRWFPKKNFSEGPALSIGPFHKVQHEVIYFLYVVRKNEKPPYIFSKNCSIHGKNCETSGPYNFWTSVKFLDLIWFKN